VNDNFTQEQEDGGFGEKKKTTDHCLLFGTGSSKLDSWIKKGTAASLYYSLSSRLFALNERETKWTCILH
jgi:hypothetical protein